MTITKKQAQRLHGLIAQNDQAHKVWYHAEGAQMAVTAAAATNAKKALNEYIVELTESDSAADFIVGSLFKQLAETYELNTAIRKESNVEIKVSNATIVKNIKPGEKFRIGSYDYLKVGDADAGNGQTFNAVNLQTNMLAALLPLTTAELSSKPIKASELKVGDVFVKDGKLGIRSENLKGDYAEVAFAGSDANGLHIDAEVYLVKSVSVNI